MQVGNSSFESNNGRKNSTLCQNNWFLNYTLNIQKRNAFGASIAQEEIFFSTPLLQHEQSVRKPYGKQKTKLSFGSFLPKKEKTVRHNLAVPLSVRGPAKRRLRR